MDKRETLFSMNSLSLSLSFRGHVWSDVVMWLIQPKTWKCLAVCICVPYIYIFTKLVHIIHITSQCTVTATMLLLLLVVIYVKPYLLSSKAYPIRVAFHIASIHVHSRIIIIHYCFQPSSFIGRKWLFFLQKIFLSISLNDHFSCVSCFLFLLSTSSILTFLVLASVNFLFSYFLTLLFWNFTFYVLQQIFYCVFFSLKFLFVYHDVLTNGSN